VGDGAVGVAAAVGDPGAAAGAQDRVQGRGQAAGRPHAAHVLAVVGVDEWLAVGHDDQPGAAQPGAGHFFEALAGPGHGSLLSGPGTMLQRWSRRQGWASGTLYDAIGVPWAGRSTEFRVRDARYRSPAPGTRYSALGAPKNPAPAACRAVPRATVSPERTLF